MYRCLRRPAGALPSSRIVLTRSASTAASPTLSPVRAALTASLVIASGALITAYYLDSRAAVNTYVITPILRWGVDAETAHKLALRALRSGWAPKDRVKDDERLKVEILGHTLSNPIGLAAGFDKDGEAIDGLFDLGFGWVEIGSVTPKPQPGNPSPRVFRLPYESAIINRYGFPSKGHTSLLTRLLARGDADERQPRLLTLNLGKNKSSPPDSIDDFVTGIRTFAPHVDVLVVNVSSPNTPGLRSLQSRGMLEEVLGGVVRERDAVSSKEEETESHHAEGTKSKPQILVKIAPDLTEEELRDVAEAVVSTGVDGVIVSNTTIQRPSSLVSAERRETGGLSGPPVKSLALKAVQTIRPLLPASVALIGCGGISSGKDALDFAREGCNGVQLYTSLIYSGPGVVRRIKDELVEELKKEGTTWAALVNGTIAQRALKPPVLSEETLKEDHDELTRILGEGQSP